MIYHALFIVNHVSYGILVETPYAVPNVEVLRHAHLAAQILDYSKIRVLKDRGDFFVPHHTGGPYPESELLQWVRSGCGTFQWHDLMHRKPLKQRTPSEHGKTDPTGDDR